MLFSLRGLPLGIVATVLFWHAPRLLDGVAIVTSMSYIGFYTWGAGRTPRKGSLAVVAVIAVGVAASLAAGIAFDVIPEVPSVYAQPSLADYANSIIRMLEPQQVVTFYGSTISRYVTFAAVATVALFVKLALGGLRPPRRGDRPRP